MTTLINSIWDGTVIGFDEVGDGTQFAKLKKSRVGEKGGKPRAYAKSPRPCLRCDVTIMTGDPITWSPTGPNSGKAHAYHWPSCEHFGPKPAEGEAPPTPAPTPEHDWSLPLEKENPTPAPTLPHEAPKTENATPTPTPTPAPDKGDPMQALAEILKPYLAGELEAKIETALGEIDSFTEEVLKQVAQTVKDTLGDVQGKPVPIKVEYKAEFKTLPLAHENLKFMLEHISAKHNIYSWGPCGTGKSFAVDQIAELLGLECYYMAVDKRTLKSEFRGTKSPINGEVFGTLFKQAWEHGGVLCIDEADNAGAHVANLLCSAIASGRMDFPDRMIPKHEDCIIICCGNTNGMGGTEQFPERLPLGSAFRDRFKFLYWDIDTKLEQKATLDIYPQALPWFQWVLKVRQYAELHHPQLVISPRASYGGAESLRDTSASIEYIAESCVFKGFDKDSVSILLEELPYPVIERSSAVEGDKNEGVA